MFSRQPKAYAIPCAGSKNNRNSGQSCSNVRLRLTAKQLNRLQPPTDTFGHGKEKWHKRHVLKSSRGVLLRAVQEVAPQKIE